MTRRKLRQLSPGACRAILLTRRAMFYAALGLILAFVVGAVGSVLRVHTNGAWIAAAFMLGMVCVGVILISLVASIALVAFFCAQYTLAQMLTVLLLINVSGTAVVLGGPGIRAYAVFCLVVLSLAVICFVLSHYPTAREIEAALEGERAT